MLPVKDDLLSSCRRLSVGGVELSVNQVALTLDIKDLLENDYLIDKAFPLLLDVPSWHARARSHNSGPAPFELQAPLEVSYNRWYVDGS